jgi:hypothetical protein
VVNNGVLAVGNKIPIMQKAVEAIVPTVSRSEHISTQVLENTRMIRDDLKLTHGSITADMAMMRDQLIEMKSWIQTQNTVHQYEHTKLTKIIQAEDTFNNLFTIEDREKASRPELGFIRSFGFLIFRQ